MRMPPLKWQKPVTSELRFQPIHTNLTPPADSPPPCANCRGRHRPLPDPHRLVPPQCTNSSRSKHLPLTQCRPSSAEHGAAPRAVNASLQERCECASASQGHATHAWHAPHPPQRRSHKPERCGRGTHGSAAPGSALTCSHHRTAQRCVPQASPPRACAARPGASPDTVRDHSQPQRPHTCCCPHSRRPRSLQARMPPSNKSAARVREHRPQRQASFEGCPPPPRPTHGVASRHDLAMDGLKAQPRHCSRRPPHTPCNTQVPGGTHAAS